MSSQENSATTRALFDFKLWELLAVLLDMAKPWNVSRNVVGWFLVALVFVNDENDAAPGLRIMIRRLTFLPYEPFTKRAIMEVLLELPTAPAFFSSLMRIKILEGKDLEWDLPIANAATDIPCYESLSYGLTHLMCHSEDGLGSPFLSFLSHYIRKFTPIHGLTPCFSLNDVMMDPTTLSWIIKERRRVRLDRLTGNSD